MPKCSHCNKSQSRLNKGGLCKGCNYNNASKNSLNNTMVTKETINDEICSILKDQVEFLKSEITVKNTMIESVLVELYNRSPESTNDESVSVTSKSNNDLSESLNVLSTSHISIKHNNDLNMEGNYDNQSNLLILA